ncbi:MAG: SMI1/KNR4 family protein [Chloroflexota bacterium]|nr:SMI1/KNR4 family protein [Chloroflexota bacterium]
MNIQGMEHQGSRKMDEDEITLCDRIFEKCQRCRWHAGDEYNTARYRTNDRRYDYFIDEEGNRITIDHDHPHKISFAYPPASDETLQATEQALGFPLPPLLCQLYAQIANGGFGPGYGLIGALGGFDEAGNLVELYQSHSRRAQLVDLEQYQHSSADGAPLELPDTVWPRFLLYLCDWGEAKVSCLDCTTGSIFLVHMGKKRHTYVLEPQAPSLYTWWEQWLEEKPVTAPTYRSMHS